MNKPFIKAVQLSKKFHKGKREIIPVRQLSFEVASAEFISLMGPSGSGKTTLLNLIAGIDSPSEGTLDVGSHSLHEMNREQLTKWRSKHVGYIFQLYHLMPVLTAFENVELPLLLHNINKKERREKVEAVLEHVGLSDRLDHFPNELSGGQEQRVAIARALVTEPSMIVADEPTGDLDRESADEILDLLEGLSAYEKKTVVMVTHDPKAALRATRCLELEKGKLITRSEILA
jgi:putative ABC transport system ATP-binding protein|tara:strand:+ start:34 stop:729 length:696 start_codon:yes stop_codon:yes gene_type:complete